MRAQVLKLLFNLSFSVVEREKLAETNLAEKLIPMLEIKVSRYVPILETGSCTMHIFF